MRHAGSKIGGQFISRSVFFERFNRTVGIPPMEYLQSWRMALARRMLRGKEGSAFEIAERGGYRSASTFSVASVDIPGYRQGNTLDSTTMKVKIANALASSLFLLRCRKSTVKKTSVSVDT